MASVIPVFKYRGQLHQADGCRPLIQAAAAGQVRLEAGVHGHYPGRKLPRHALQGVKSVGFWDARKNQNWGLDWHRNEGIELTILETGAVDFGVDDARYRLVPNDLTITRPWQLHRVGNPHIEACRLHWLILDLGVRRPHQLWQWPSWLVLSSEDVAQLTHMLRHNEQPVWPDSQDLLHCFKRIAALVASRDLKRSISKLTLLLNELLLRLMERLRMQEIALDKSLSDSRRSVAIFLDELAQSNDLLAHDWSVQELASACGLGVTRFVHYVRQLKNMTPSRFLNQCRLNEAANILAAEPGTTITQVAMACGFSSSQYFATAFHQQFGISPSDFRASKIAPSTLQSLAQERPSRK